MSICDIFTILKTYLMFYTLNGINNKINMQWFYEKLIKNHNITILKTGIWVRIKSVLTINVGFRIRESKNPESRTSTNPDFSHG